MLKGFKEFITRGNVIELAVGVIIANSFTPVVESVTNLIMGLIAAIFGSPNFDEVGMFTLNNAVIQPGTIITTVVNFLLVAVAVYFFIVVPMNTLAARRKTEEPKEKPEDVVLLQEIKDILAAQRSA
ncbi:MAG TPA: large conductance mechanosensitive channel protein MscL [Actinomycetaceae bacterium]|nr:large conductance mechanosensitive channel protein MscL [Actinomycetaceae bacterium]